MIKEIIIAGMLIVIRLRISILLFTPTYTARKGGQSFHKMIHISRKDHSTVRAWIHHVYRTDRGIRKISIHPSTPSCKPLGTDEEVTARLERGFEGLEVFYRNASD